uniref:Guanylate cyclase domain-containing protein n=1 Tax=Strongyloides stercoralis TaxID=6248 RepID=A0A0K0DWB6_STRER
MLRIIEIHSYRRVDRDASQKDIKKAFYELSKKHHPDMNPGNHEKAAETFSQVAKAYEILSNNFKRKEYDETIRPPPRGYSDVRRGSHFTQSKKNYTDLNIDLKDFESFQRSARIRRGVHEKYDMPDEFFAKFGGKKFKSKLSEDEIPHTFNYKDRVSAEREIEEEKILKEIEEEQKKSRYPLPTFEQLIQQQKERKYKESLKLNIAAASIFGTLLFVLAFSKLR